MIDGATVLVTGARGGIGRALVAAFLANGATHIIAADRTPEPPDHDPRVQRIALDVTDRAATLTAAAQLGRVDILVNNAGVNGNRGLFASEATDQARREMEVNYFGTLHMAQAFAPAMRQRRVGTLVQILSFVAFANLPVMATYSASKAATLSLNQALRAELSPFGLRVVGVFPRLVATRMAGDIPIAKLAPKDLAAAVINGLREGTEDIFPGSAAASYAAFLADPASLAPDNATRLPPETRALLQQAGI
jgi:NAD(P)-dependent dehydrogenase (short-subunit alcohol dehydrogenase family)